MIKELNYLSEIKETQHLTNKEIAKALNVTEVTISNWMENKTTPQRHLRAKIMKFASQYWTPGIIELPPCPGVWNNYICLRVYNINNPFDTIIDLEWTGNETRIWPRMIEGWSKSYYKIRKSYNHPSWFLQSIIDETKYNCTFDLLTNPSWNYYNSNPEDIAWDIIEEYEAGKYPLLPNRI